MSRVVEGVSRFSAAALGTPTPSGWSPALRAGAAVVALALGRPSRRIRRCSSEHRGAGVARGDRELPFVFAASGALRPRVSRSCWRRGGSRRRCVGSPSSRVAREVALSALMERRMGSVGDAYRTGPAGRYRRASSALLLAGVGGALAAGPRRPLLAHRRPGAAGRFGVHPLRRLRGRARVRPGPALHNRAAAPAARQSDPAAGLVGDPGAPPISRRARAAPRPARAPGRTSQVAAFLRMCTLGSRRRARSFAESPVTRPFRPSGTAARSGGPAAADRSAAASAR